MSVHIASPVEAKPWRFPTAYLTNRPMELPLGTSRSLVILNWRAIPYKPPTRPTVISEAIVVGLRPPVVTTITRFGDAPDVSSDGVVLWDHSTAA